VLGLRTISGAIASVFLCSALLHGQAHVSLIRGVEGGDGTAGQPFRQINDALDAGHTDILVWPSPMGQPYDTVTVDASSVTVHTVGGPGVTAVDGVIVAEDRIDVVIQGLRFAGNVGTPEAGAWVRPGSSVTFRNCVATTLTYHGIRIQRTLEKTTHARIENSVVYGCGLSGLYVEGLSVRDGFRADPVYLPDVYVVNSIITGNEEYAVHCNPCPSGPDLRLVDGRVRLDYSFLENNPLNNCPEDPGFQVTHPVTDGLCFVAADLGCFELCEDQTEQGPLSLRHRGHPGVQYQNPDGTRSDLGAFGGPGAVPYATRLLPGATITRVILEPVSATGGDTIRVKVVVRGVR